MLKCVNNSNKISQVSPTINMQKLLRRQLTALKNSVNCLRCPTVTIKKIGNRYKKLGGFQVFFPLFFSFFKDKPREEINEDAARKRQRAKNIAPCWNLWAPASACVCFMLFDGSRGERLTVCQCHSLSADVSAPGTRFGEINNKKHKNENARSALQRRGLPSWHSRQNPGKKKC